MIKIKKHKKYLKDEKRFNKKKAFNVFIQQ